MKFLTIAAAAALLASAVALPTEVDIDSKQVTRTESAAANFNFTTDFDGPLNSFFSTLENIPDSVLEQGDDALDKWLLEHGMREPGVTPKRSDETSRSEPPAALQARASWWRVAKCVAAIVQMLATTAVPAAKIFRIKKYIEALGGAKQAVQLLLGATSRAEKLKAGGEVLVNLSAELLGISSVKNNCF